MDTKDDDYLPAFSYFDAEHEEGKRLRHLRIDPDADPIDILEALMKESDSKSKAEGEGS